MLDQVSPKPEEVYAESAMKYPNKNRSNNFPPRKFVTKSLNTIVCVYFEYTIIIANILSIASYDCACVLQLKDGELL